MTWLRNVANVVKPGRWPVVDWLHPGCGKLKELGAVLLHLGQLLEGELCCVVDTEAISE